MAHKKIDVNLERIEKIISIAHQLFEEKGYEQVGIRDICSAAGLSPTQLYRLGLTKQDLLAEVILRVNDRQIQMIKPFSSSRLKSAQSFIEDYLLNLYKSDIDIKGIRTEGAAFGWKWTRKYEEKIVEQIFELITPIKDALEKYQYNEINARCFGIWSLYYVGYRNAVMKQASAEECLASIKPSLSLLLKK